MTRLAFVGDVHGYWTAEDAAWFDRAGYDRVVFVGDLAGYTWQGTRRVAEALAQLRTPTLLVPGNHDTPHALQLLGEALGRPWLGRPFVRSQGRKLRALRAALGPVELAAWSCHPLSDGLALIAGRPHSMGGPSLSFRKHLADTWGVSSLEEAGARLCALVDAAPAERLIFVAHNGPSGLGAERDAIWGCDFRPEAGDWGDPDLRAGIEHARSQGKQVLAVVAGHMHHSLRGGGRRSWLVERDGVLYLNAARVPRIRRRDGLHHHLALEVSDDGVQVEERFVDPRVEP